MNKRGLTTAALTALALAVPAGAAEAAFPGANGEIAYTRPLDFAPHLQLLDPSSGAVRDLTSPDSFDLDASWTADGSRAIFRCNDYLDSDICTANPDGSGYRELGFDETTQVHFNPSLSPDGSRMLYEAEESTERGRGIYMANADGTGVRRLAGGREPVWSPDGRRIAFDRYSGTTTDLYLINPDGSGLKRLTHNPADDRDPDFAPDGKSLVFVSERSGSPEIHVTNAAGTQTRKLTGDPAVDSEPGFSPDGRRIAWERETVSGSPYQNEVYVMNADASQKTRTLRGGAPAWRPLRRSR